MRRALGNPFLKYDGDRSHYYGLTTQELIELFEDEIRARISNLELLIADKQDGYWPGYTIDEFIDQKKILHQLLDRGKFLGLFENK